MSVGIYYTMYAVYVWNNSFNFVNVNILSFNRDLNTEKKLQKYPENCLSEAFYLFDIQCRKPSHVFIFLTRPLNLIYWVSFCDWPLIEYGIPLKCTHMHDSGVGNNNIRDKVSVTVNILVLKV